ncbi:MAG: RDD family protein [Chloroflexota bacterium]
MKAKGGTGRRRSPALKGSPIERPGALEPAFETAQPPPVDDAIPGVAGTVLAATGVRIAAYVIDYLILIGLTLAFNSILDRLLVGGPAGASGAIDEVRNAGTFALDAAYFIGLWTGGRRTIGMWLLGIRVVRADDAGNVRAGPATKRWLVINAANLLAELAFRILPVDAVNVGFLISIFTAYGWPLILLASVAATPTRQGFHDRVAGTAVIVAGRRRSAGEGPKPARGS